MQNTVHQYLTNISAGRDKEVLQMLMQYMARAFNSVALRSAGLEIAGTATLAQIGSSSTYVATVNGKLVTIAAGTDMPALVGTVTADAFNVYAFFVDAASTVTSVMGTEGSTLARVKFPQVATDKALVGFVIVNPTGTGNFVGGTTDLDDATVAPNAVYVSPVGAFDPTFLYN